MGLVDYSDSDSDSEAVQTKPTSNPVAATSTSTAKKPTFQKLVDRAGAGSGKIIVNLPTAAAAASPQSEDGPPAKRVKTAATGSSRFSSFGSFLPPPKKTTATTSSAPAPAPAPAADHPTTTTTSNNNNNNKPTARPLINLKTGSEPAFNRGGDDDGDDTFNSHGSGLGLPPPRKASAGPSIPAGQKDESEVKLVGKPLMFKPLSVARRPGQTKTKKKTTPYGGGAAKTTATTTAEQQDHAPPPAKKKISLFSMDAGDSNNNHTAPEAETPDVYEPLFSGAVPLIDSEAGFTDPSTAPINDPHNLPPAQTQHQSQSQPQSLSSIADALSLSASARRELFGRAHGGGSGAVAGAVPAGAKVISFNMEQEYAHNNEVLRTATAAEKEVYNPVRSIAPGKHSLRQMVNMVQNNQDALEESFIQGKNTRKDAAGRYGWK
ncbi:mitotic checkpoint regulator, MAD2B-interacting-domain-containing protein [Podospora appendiculata]|uniref:Mitotic checkpoint regulator, MAD2B-interacting-domain-containing protein n=1 Tax=Podospora appendiculata TaxID=314037 RepID=A0AAE0XFF4_9PEZI|nr:mitotic checkpoint regulator, MAD2B-interacting-domain-containing protein [Podospora appendiculata]